MYARLDKLREDLQKAIAKRDEAEKKVKQLQAKLKEEENQQIVSDVASYNLSPEQLAQFLQLAGSGKLQELLNGQVKMPEPVTMNHAGAKPAEDEENLFDEDEADDQDEDNYETEEIRIRSACWHTCISGICTTSCIRTGERSGVDV